MQAVFYVSPLFQVLPSRMILSIKLVILLTVKTDFPESIMKVFLLNLTDVLLKVVHFCSLLMKFYIVTTLVSLKWDARVAPILNVF